MSGNDCNTIIEMLNELRPILRTVPMNQVRFRSFLDRYRLDISQNTINNIGICSSVAVNISDNIITVPLECVTNVERACRLEEERGANYAECFRRFRPSIRNVTQNNIASVEHNCNIISLLNDDAVQRNTRLALVLKLLLGNKSMSCFDGVSNSLSFLNESNSSVDVLNTCLNESFLVQSNNLNVCYADGVLQENISNVIQNCSIESEVQSGTPISQPPSSQTPSRQPQSRQPLSRQPSSRQPSQPSGPGNLSRVIKFNPAQIGSARNTGSTNTPIIIMIVVTILCLLCSSFFVFMNMK